MSAPHPIKVFALIPKRADIDDAEFHAHWRDPHGVLAQRIKAMRRYVQSHRLPGPGAGLGDAPYDGVAEVWYDDVADAVGLKTDPDYTEYAQRDEPNFIDLAGLTSVTTEEHVLEPGPQLARDDPTVKVLHLVRRPPEADPQEWRDTWPAAGTAAAAALGAQRHAASLAIPDTGDDGGYDGVRELTWPDRDAFEAGRRDAPDAWRALADPSLVADTSSGVLAEEYRVIWP